MKKKIFLSLVLFLFAESAFAQSCVYENFPLKIGNIFIFKSSVTTYFPVRTVEKYYKTQILKDTIVNFRRYFFMSYYCEYKNRWWRIDTLSGNLFTFDSTNYCPNYFKERLIDSLCVSQGDSTKGCGNYVKCTDGTNHFLFNQSYPSRTTVYKFVYPGVYTETITRKYDMGFGLVYYHYSGGGMGGGAEATADLRGCIIDGVMYGDTVTVGINLISSEVPENYSLSQNYPNPFNPSTKINYEIKNSGFVNLKVFDLLGKEVATLVNEKQNAGSYAVDFNSSEFSLPSGIYFYTLNAGEFTETRKMVLVK